MATQTGAQLAEGIRQEIDELARACSGLGEEDAKRDPEGRWTPKEILSHLLGPQKGAYLAVLHRFLDEDVPTIELVSERTHFSPERAAMPISRYLEELGSEFGRLADFTARLTPEQLDRKAHIPLFKDSPLTEYPSLEGMIHGLGIFHVRFHIDHLREVVKELSGS
jgi:hypothetical protein